MFNRTIIFSVLGLLGGFIPAHADSLGTVGRTYEIREKDAIEVLKSEVEKQLGNGGQEKMIQEAYDRHIGRLHDVPTPSGMTQTKKASVRLVDLTYTVPEAVRDERGNIVVPKGMRINPLQLKPLTKRVFFIHGDNKKHLDYVKLNAAHNDRVIALAGSVLRSSAYLNRQVYMDMVGLSKQMKLTSYPAVVSQVGTQLRIEELSL